MFPQALQAVFICFRLFLFLAFYFEGFGLVSLLYIFFPFFNKTFIKFDNIGLGFLDVST